MGILGNEIFDRMDHFFLGTFSCYSLQSFPPPARMAQKDLRCYQGCGGGFVQGFGDFAKV
jgi:hypothetical protein